MRYLFIILTFLSFAALGQNTITKNVYSKMSVLADTSVALPSGYGGLRYNQFHSPPEWQINNGSGWTRFGGSGGISSCKPAGHQYTSVHTLVIGDINSCNNMGIIRMVTASPVNLTIPLHSSVAFEQWTQIGVLNEGTDTVTVLGVGGVTANPTSIEIPPQGAAILVNADGANTWDLGGGGGGGSSSLTNGNGTTFDTDHVDLGGTQSDSIRIVGANKNFTLDGQDRIRLNPDSLLIYTRDTLRLSLDKYGYLSHTGSGFVSSGSNSVGFFSFSTNPYGAGFYNANNNSRASVLSITPTTVYFNSTNGFGGDASITLNSGSILFEADSLLKFGTTNTKIGFSGFFGTTGQMLKVNATGGLDFFSPSGTYTPTLTNTTNVAASTAYVTGWYRTGTMVTVFGKVDIDVTLAASSATELGISLPVASNMTGEQDLGGTAISDSIASLAARIRGDATNDRASIVFKAISLTNDSYSFEFSYQIK